MKATVQLYQDGGVSGPRETIDYVDEDSVRDWVDGQIGHPWDGVLVNVYDDEPHPGSGPINTYELELEETNDE